MHSSTCPGAKGFTTIAERHRSKAPTGLILVSCNCSLTETEMAVTLSDETSKTPWKEKPALRRAQKTRRPKLGIRWSKGLQHHVEQAALWPNG